MEQESKGRMKRGKLGIPDPLHFEFQHNHKKVLELIYICVVLGAIVLLLILGSMRVFSVREAETSALMVLLLSVLLGIMIFEKSSIIHRPKRPA